MGEMKMVRQGDSWPTERPRPQALTVDGSFEIRRDNQLRLVVDHI